MRLDVMTGKKVFFFTIIVLALVFSFVDTAQAAATNPEGFDYALGALSADESAIGWTFGDTGNPNEKGYYRFDGSLTTPPCSEGVWWLVMKEPVKVSKQQIELFSQVMHHPNNRPVQPVNDRLVLQ